MNISDMKMERNMLMEKTYPKLKKYCKEKYGLEFQVTLQRLSEYRAGALTSISTIKDTIALRIRTCQM